MNRTGGELARKRTIPTGTNGQLMSQESLESAPAGLLRRILESRLFDAGIVVLGLAGLRKIGIALQFAATQNDFAHYYTSSRLLIDGAPLYTTPLAPLYAQYGFVYEKEMAVAMNFLKKQSLDDFAHVLLNLNEFLYVR